MYVYIENYENYPCYPFLPRSLRKLTNVLIFPVTTCNYNLRLQDSNIHQGILELGIRQSDSSGTRVSCDFEIDAGPGKHVMFYFVHAQLTPEGQQYDVSCIEIKDNVGNIQTTVEGRLFPYL